jgi:hypothetical protein
MESRAFERGTGKARKSLYGLQVESGRTQKALLGMAKSAAGPCWVLALWDTP